MRIAASWHSEQAELAAQAEQAKQATYRTTTEWSGATSDPTIGLIVFVYWRLLAWTIRTITSAGAYCIASAESQTQRKSQRAAAECSGCFVSRLIQSSGNLASQPVFHFALLHELAIQSFDHDVGSSRSRVPLRRCGMR